MLNTSVYMPISISNFIHNFRHFKCQKLVCILLKLAFKTPKWAFKMPNISGQKVAFNIPIMVFKLYEIDPCLIDMFHENLQKAYLEPILSFDVNNPEKCYEAAPQCSPNNVKTSWKCQPITKALSHHVTQRHR